MGGETGHDELSRRRLGTFTLSPTALARQSISIDGQWFRLQIDHRDVMVAAVSRNRSLFPLLLLALTFAVPASPAAANTWKRCEGTKFWSCTELTVPLDYANPAGPTLRLAVGRMRIGKQPTPSAELVLTGGPGAAGMSSALLDSRRGRDRDLLTVDLRGTGKSGALDCKLRTRATLDADVRSCWDKLGEARTQYTTANVIRDLDAIRQHAGYAKLDLQAYSYGTKVALDYAAAFPASTGRLTLDSVVPRRGPDPWMSSTLRAVPRVVREFCASDRCDGITEDAIADLGVVIAALRPGLKTRAYDPRGRARTITLTESTLAGIFLAADYDVSLHPRIPAALASARAKDYAPLARLSRDAVPTGELFPDVPVTEVSAGTWLATYCEDVSMPWSPATTLPERHALIRTLAAARPAESWGPFSPAVIDQTEITSCAAWPTSGTRSEPELAPLPQIPILVLSGSADVRTPLEDAAALVAATPGAVLATALGAGHSGASAADVICKTWLDDWETKGGARQCDLLRSAELSPLPPARLSDLPSAKGVSGRRGRTITAVRETIADSTTVALTAVFNGANGGGGLRGGAWTGDFLAPKLNKIEYVPGVEVSGRIDTTRKRIRVTVGGRAAAKGWIEFDSQLRVKRGRLAGKSL